MMRIRANEVPARPSVSGSWSSSGQQSQGYSAVAGRCDVADNSVDAAVGFEEVAPWNPVDTSWASPHRAQTASDLLQRWTADAWKRSQLRLVDFSVIEITSIVLLGTTFDQNKRRR